MHHRCGMGAEELQRFGIRQRQCSRQPAEGELVRLQNVHTAMRHDVIVLSEHGEPMVDINTLVLPGSDIEVVDAFQINDRGEIAGGGILPNGDFHAVLLVPASAADIAAAAAAPNPLTPRPGLVGQPRPARNTPVRSAAPWLHDLTRSRRLP